MNKKLIYLGLTLVTLFASCSGDSELLEESTPKGVDPNSGIGATIEYSDQEIRFARLDEGSLTRSRGPVDSENGVFSADNLGIFCIADKILGVNPNAPSDLRINNWEESYTWYSRIFLLNNQKAKVVDSEVLMVDDNDNTVTKYYPSDNWYGYYFVGYHPYSEDITFDTDRKYVYANYELDGTQDVFYGNATGTGNGAYSAYYYSNLPSGSVKEDYLPTLSMKHMLVRFNFRVQAKNAQAKYLFDNQNLVVDKIVIPNVRYKCKLTLAYRGNPGAIPPEGGISFKNDDGSYSVRDFTLQPKHANYDYEILKSDEELAVNEELEYENGDKFIGSMMVPAISAAYGIKLYLKRGNESSSSYLVANNIKLNMPSGGYVAGKEYDVTITLTSPVSADVRATLTGWDHDNTDLGVEM